MSRYRDVVDWISGHPEVVLDLTRAYLGIGLFVRGILFISQTEGLSVLVDLSEFSLASAALVHYVTFAHLIGGLLLAVGLLTRIAALIQIPILFGAVFLVHLHDGLLSANQSLEFSALVLFLLGVVFVFGAGRWSADHYVFVREPELQEEEGLEMWWRDGDEREPVAAGDGSGAGSPAGGVATQTRPVTQAALKERAAAALCACGNDLNHPRVVIEPRYRWTAGFYFMLGISAPVKEIMWYCEECGTVMNRSRDPELLERYRWHTS
jgi:uncharacterized membrane protein YphA (DoxX/SURF4 family)